MGTIVIWTYLEKSLLFSEWQPPTLAPLISMNSVKLKILLVTASSCVCPSIRWKQWTSRVYISEPLPASKKKSKGTEQGQGEDQKGVPVEVFFLDWGERRKGIQ